MHALLGAVVDRRSLLGLGATAAAAVMTMPTAPATRPGLYLVGDSWGAGFHADPKHALGQVAAATLGWTATVNAVSGTGYLNAAGTGGTYPARTAVLSHGQTQHVVVLQGGSNDDNQDLTALPAAVHATLRLAAHRFRRARIVMLGPGPDPAPVTGLQRQVDGILQRAAEVHGVPYISMLQENWISSANLADVIDPANNHPTVAGQRYLGTRLADSLQRLYPHLTALRDFDHAAFSSVA